MHVKNILYFLCLIIKPFALKGPLVVVAYFYSALIFVQF